MNFLEERKQLSRERAERGAAWLDERFPGWEPVLNLGLLKMEDCFKCVLGQVLDTKYQECDRFCGNGYVHGVDCFYLEDPRWYGFDGTLEELDYLQDAWTELIKDRYDRGALSGMQDGD